MWVIIYGNGVWTNKLTSRMKGKNWFQAASIKLLLVFEMLVPRTCRSQESACHSHQAPTNPPPKSCSVLYHHCCLGLQTRHLLRRETKFCFAMSEQENGKHRKMDLPSSKLLQSKIFRKPSGCILICHIQERLSNSLGGHTLN